MTTPSRTPPDRRTINCRVSVEAYDTWREVCERHGVSLTALLEAIAAEYRQRLDADEPTPTQAVIVDRARQIDADRRARRPEAGD